MQTSHNIGTLGFKNSKVSTKTIVTNPNKFNDTVNTLH